MSIFCVTYSIACFILFIAPIITLAFDENTTATYTCPSGVIKVLSSTYVSQLDPTCGGAPTSVIAARCDGMAVCTFAVTNANVGGDPCVGPFKTLTTTYTCI